MFQIKNTKSCEEKLALNVENSTEMKNRMLIFIQSTGTFVIIIISLFSRPLTIY